MADQSELTPTLPRPAAQPKQQEQPVDIRSALNELGNNVLADHEERLRRLEDFMRRAS